METLLHCYSTIHNTYYGNTVNSNDLFSETGKENCYRFIKDFFKYGEKEKVFSFDFKSEYKNNGKHIHTVSLFLLGKYLEKIFNPSIFKKIMESISASDWYNYEYTWFLTCLYHDTASCIEEIRMPLNTSNSQKQLDFYLGNFNIIYTPYNYVPKKYGVCLTRFSEQLIKNYFFYRAISGNCEHGIIGGYLLFDRFVKNFYKHTKNHNFDEEPYFGKDGLNWRREHLDHAAYISDAIICHNIWLSNNKKLYEAYGLSPLIEEYKNILSFVDYPLQFVLCLLDTIEPTKRFEELPPKVVLESIKIEIIKPTSIKIYWEAELQEEKNFLRWRDGIINLKDWMKVETKEEGSSITIEW